jgi:ABC-type transport system substrate-binding protein
VADNFIQGNPDRDVQGAFFLMGYGVAETLMRVSPTMALEPGLAAKLEQPDPLTTVVTLRDDVTFHDGSKMDAESVKASLERSIEKQPALDPRADLAPGRRIHGGGLLHSPTDLSCRARAITRGPGVPHTGHVRQRDAQR